MKNEKNDGFTCFLREIMVNSRMEGETHKWKEEFQAIQDCWH